MLFRSQRAAFPLEGKHAAVACVKCHQPNGPGAVFRTGKLACNSCHTDAHAGEFAAAPNSNRCELCHTPAGFENVTFNADRHQQTRFPLTGRHSEVACRNCHLPLAGPDAAPDSVAGLLAAVSLRDREANAKRRFRFSTTGCSGCHEDPHGLGSTTKWSCSTCHSPRQWNEVTPFDHAQTSFPLEGAHSGKPDQPMACVQCHRATERTLKGRSISAPQFTATSKACGSCHSDKNAHADQFVNADGSKGIHNAPFAVGILKASIADLTGDSNNDGIPDS